MHHMPDMFGELTFESMDEEITILESELNCFVKVAIFWLKNEYRVR
jgi:hypothetical protein